MMTNVSGDSTALDVATSLAVLTSEHLAEPFKDKFITFSRNPKYVDLSGCQTLRDKLILSFKEAECMNTDIEATMDLILRSAVKNHIKQEDIPTVVIISDMEFDEARGCYSWRGEDDPNSQETLFKTISNKWAASGYKLPRMVFWNTCSRTGAVPMHDNENGLLLISGFSQNILDLLSYGGDMVDIIRKKLSDKRYDCITEALKA